MFPALALLVLATIACTGAHIIGGIACVIVQWLWRNRTIRENNRQVAGSQGQKPPVTRPHGWRGGTFYRIVTRTLALALTLNALLMLFCAIVASTIRSDLLPAFRAASLPTIYWLAMGLLSVLLGYVSAWLMVTTEHVRTTTFGKVFIATAHLAAVSLGIGTTAFVLAAYIYPNANAYPFFGIGIILTAPTALLTSIRLLMTAAPKNLNVK